MPKSPLRAAGPTVLLCLTAAVAMAAAPAADSSKAAENHFNIGLSHLREGRAQMALDEFKRAVKMDAKNPYFYKGLAVAYGMLADQCPPSGDRCRQEKNKEAIAAARKALELNPYFVDAHNDLGAALLRAGQREEGKKELLTAYNDPTNPTPEFSSHNLGRAYLEEGNFAEALSWFRTSLGRNPKYPDAYLGAAEALMAMGRADEAVVQLETAAKEVPAHAPLLVALGEAYYRAGRFGEARPQLEQAARQDPGGPSGRRAQELLRHFPK